MEVLIATAMAVILLGAVVTGIKACHDSAATIKRNRALNLAATELMQLVFRLDYGNAGDPAPTAGQLAALLDMDDLLGTATLSSLRVPAGQPGFIFQIATIPYAGNWELRVSADLNVDGDELDVDEGSPDLLRIDILFAGSIVLESFRGEPLG